MVTELVVVLASDITIALDMDMPMAMAMAMSAPSGLATGLATGLAIQMAPEIGMGVDMANSDYGCGNGSAAGWFDASGWGCCGDGRGDGRVSGHG
jgi:hydrogenase/urease accessory protein HupE